MKLISRLRGKKFCAYCRSPRKFYVKKHVDLTNVVGLLVLTLAVTYVAWGEPDPRGLFIFSTGIVLAETFIYLRWRASIVCTMCGFDPVIYKKSPAAAAALVGRFYRERRDNPKFQLSRSPLLEVHRRALHADRKRGDREEVERLKAARLARQPNSASLAPGTKAATTRERVATEPTVR